jgi:hypothetical protein
MMQFEQITPRFFRATNSLRVVMIAQEISGHWMLHTPDGGLQDKFQTRGPFTTFDAARKNAEMNVGFTWKELAEALTR